ncbi:MAG: PhoH family protein [Clostridiales bacterium]|nr:MAG: PhoH family protein [Clostridiales bacterium]
MSEYYKSKAKSVHQPTAFRKPTATEITAIIKMHWRHLFECIAPLGLRISNDKGQYLKPSEEQLHILDTFRNCKQVIIHGSSGTGKTLLAVELAKRKSDSKKRKLL